MNLVEMVVYRIMQEYNKSSGIEVSRVVTIGEKQGLHEDDIFAAIESLRKQGLCFECGLGVVKPVFIRKGA